MYATSNDGVSIWFETEGEGQLVALLPGRGDSSDLFPRCFTDELVGAGFAVLRIDTRDAGLSGDGGDSYTMATLADDVAAVLDEIGASRAQVLGFSMGGIVLTDFVARHADRVSSCCFVSAMSPDPEAGIGEDFFASFDESDLVEATLHGMGTPTHRDRQFVEDEIRRAFERAPARPEAGERHQAAALRFGWPELEVLASVDAPSLAVHGSADRSLPVRHAQAFGRQIPTCQVEIIDGMGHIPTQSEWNAIADLVIAHLTNAHE